MGSWRFLDDKIHLLIFRIASSICLLLFVKVHLPALINLAQTRDHIVLRFSIFQGNFSFSNISLICKNSLINLILT